MIFMDGTLCARFARDIGTTVVTSVGWELSLPRTVKSCTPTQPPRFPLLPAVSSSAVCSCCRCSSGNSCTHYFSRRFQAPAGWLPGKTLQGRTFQNPSPHTFPLLQPHTPEPQLLAKATRAACRFSQPDGSLEDYSHFSQSLHSLRPSPWAVYCLCSVSAHSALGPREHPQERQSLLC